MTDRLKNQSGDPPRLSRVSLPRESWCRELGRLMEQLLEMTEAQNIDCASYFKVLYGRGGHISRDDTLQ